MHYQTPISGTMLLIIPGLNRPSSTSSVYPAWEKIGLERKPLAFHLALMIQR